MPVVIASCLTLFLFKIAEFYNDIAHIFVLSRRLCSDATSLYPFLEASEGACRLAILLLAANCCGDKALFVDSCIF